MSGSKSKLKRRRTKAWGPTWRRGFASIALGLMVIVGGIGAGRILPIEAASAGFHSASAETQSTVSDSGESETTVASTTTTTSTNRRSASGTTSAVRLALVSIAAVTAVMAAVYFWYTIPSRRKRIAERRQ